MIEDTNASTPASAETAPSLTAQLEAVKAERQEYQQKWLLAIADLENYRRRVSKEMEQDRRFASLPLARDLLPALDNLQRGLEAARVSHDTEKLIEGVQMVARQLDEVLARHSVVPIQALDQPFDPNLHQALQQVPTADKPPLTVLAEYERGFMMHDRVVRPSTVIVSAPVAAAE
ncbi:MAG: nucleotide exchange factor GrpE [Planctomycetales bacterium]